MGRGPGVRGERMPLTSLPVRVSRPVSVAQAFPSGRRCPPLVPPSSGFGTPVRLHSSPEGTERDGGPQVGMFRVTAFLLPKSGPFTQHLAVKECRVRCRPVEKLPPSSGAGASPPRTGRPLATGGQGKVPCAPEAGTRCGVGVSGSCPTPLREGPS